MLKAEFHAHCKGDPKDLFISYTAYDLINRAAKLGFQVLALTCHDYIYNDPKIKKYAQGKNIILLLGMEMTLESKHVLIYNITKEQAKQIKTFEDLQKMKKRYPNIFVIAPHPFYTGKICLKKNVLKYFDLFDAWEYSFFYCRYFNNNKKTLRLARKYKKPLVGNSDIHLISDLGKTYTLIDAQANEKAIFAALKKGKMKIVTSPLPLFYLAKIALKIIYGSIKDKVSKIPKIVNYYW